MVNLGADCCRQRGMTYLGLLFAIALAGIGLAASGSLWFLESRREKEKELLFVGEEFRRAIGSYYQLRPSGTHQYPESLEELLLDRRFPMPVRHLRRLYRDPLSQSADWELIRQQGRIVGVASRDAGVPIKMAGFSGRQEGFAGAASYREWRFVYLATDSDGR